MNESTPLDAQRLIADFMAASSPLERYLQQGGPLTALQLESILTTMTGLQTFIDIWKRKHGQEIREQAR